VENEKLALFDKYLEYVFMIQLAVLAVFDKSLKIPMVLACFPKPITWWRQDTWIGENHKILRIAQLP